MYRLARTEENGQIIIDVIKRKSLRFWPDLTHKGTGVFSQENL